MSQFGSLSSTLGPRSHLYQHRGVPPLNSESSVSSTTHTTPIPLDLEPRLSRLYSPILDL